MELKSSFVNSNSFVASSMTAVCCKLFRENFKFSMLIETQQKNQLNIEKSLRFELPKKLEDISYIFEFEFQKTQLRRISEFWIDSFSFHFYSLQSTQKFSHSSIHYMEKFLSLSLENFQAHSHATPKFTFHNTQRSSSYNEKFQLLWISILEILSDFTPPRVYEYMIIISFGYVQHLS